MKILFLIRSLHRGGAERQLSVLAAALAARGWQVKVVVFYGGGALEGELAQAGVPVINLEKRGRWDLLGFLLRLTRLLYRERPDFLHGYLVDANLLVALAGLFVPRVKVVWGIRASRVALSSFDRTTRLAFQLSRHLSRLAHLILFNSQAGLMFHVEHGYPRRRLAVVENGIDSERFQPDPAGGQAWRRRWGIGPEAILMGFVARVDPMKDHATFLKAASLLAERHPSTAFVCVGGGDQGEGERLRAWASSLAPLHGRLVWAGEVGEGLAAAYSALDVAVLASKGEGFPNVVAEAMACGVPCVVADVGDAARIVGDDGEVVPVGDAQGLALGMERMLLRLEREGDGLSRRVRGRIVADFSRKALCDKTMAALRGCLSG